MIRINYLSHCFTVSTLHFIQNVSNMLYILSVGCWRPPRMQPRIERLSSPENEWMNECLFYACSITVLMQYKGKYFQHILSNRSCLGFYLQRQKNWSRIFIKPAASQPISLQNCMILSPWELAYDNTFSLDFYCFFVRILTSLRKHPHVTQYL